MAALCGLAKPRTFDGGPDRLVDAGDQAVGDREAGEHGQVALGDAEGHVGARGVAPLGDDAAALEDHAGRAAARQHGADDLAPRPRLVPLDDADVAAVRIVEAARPGAVARQGEDRRHLSVSRDLARRRREARFPRRRRSAHRHREELLASAFAIPLVEGQGTAVRLVACRRRRDSLGVRPQLQVCPGAKARHASAPQWPDEQQADDGIERGGGTEADALDQGAGRAAAPAAGCR